MTNKHYARKLLLLLWLPFDAVHGSFTSELVLVRAPGLKWMLRMCWRMIKLQCNHICVWLISSDICSMHFSSFSLHLRDAQRRSFRRQHFISPCRDTDELGALVLYSEQNKKLSLFRKSGWRLGKVVWLPPFLLTESFREARRIPYFYLFLAITKRAGVKCQIFDSQTKIARRAKAMSLN